MPRPRTGYRHRRREGEQPLPPGGGVAAARAGERRFAESGEIVTHPTLEIESGLGLDSLLVRMLDLAHLADQVGVLYERLVCVAAGQDHVLVLRAALECLEHL